ncbi:MAG: methylated-DNA--[protein]-cysteine S-methyltransferase [Acidobacteria bacterium]|nr:MAG: methylated-DNA--[protein]-cysteine S-methyltransferase [Acidobacteriota bacterium]
MERLIDSPVGLLKIEGDDRAVTGIRLNAKGRVSSGRPAGVLAELEHQLAAYFGGTLTVFDLPLAPKGTPFQREVWEALQSIPFGQTTTYGRIAETIGRPDAVRAVGAANGQNPIPIVIPCHRVIGASGSLTGFGGGLEMKRWLLAHESGQWSMLSGH